MDIATIFIRGFFVALVAAVAVTATIVLAGQFREQPLPPEAVCPAQWKCVGPPDTRDPDCKCWDKY